MIELTQNEERIMPENCGIANFILENFNEIYSIPYDEKNETINRKVSKNIKDLLIKIEDTCIGGYNYGELRDSRA